MLPVERIEFAHLYRLLFLGAAELSWRAANLGPSSQSVSRVASDSANFHLDSLVIVIGPTLISSGSHGATSALVAIIGSTQIFSGSHGATSALVAIIGPTQISSGSHGTNSPLRERGKNHPRYNQPGLEPRYPYHGQSTHYESDALVHLNTKAERKEYLRADDDWNKYILIHSKLIKERIWGPKLVVEKSCEVDLVTETDQQIEKLLISSLQKQFPDHKFIGEESVADGAKCELTVSPTWIIDPVDGTMNFVHGYPNVCVSVALWVDKEPQLAIVYNPVLEQLFTARRGEGAFLNGSRIHASKETELSKCLLGVEFGTSRDQEKMAVVMHNINKLVPLVHGLRSSGSAALNMALTAIGGTDANYEFGIHAWDVAAGALLVEEAGGVILDTTGGKFDVLSRRYLCAGTQTVADQIVKIIKQYSPDRD
uniref:inositol-phosphate phosphatase n=1 Tax=Timema genevievae TaxID=629358 RepID=A0A7R9PRE5_TIMGE|nr:unnamed protein product [Timema genevievae]